MAKKSSASSRRGKQIRASADSIWSKPLNDRQKAALDGIASRQKRGDASKIDYSDIPRLTAKQLAEMVRLRDVRRKQAVSVRLDPEVLEWLKSKGEGHLTRINDILANLMEAERRSGKRASSR